MFIFFVPYKSHKNLSEFMVHIQNDINISEKYLKGKKRIKKDELVVYFSFFGLLLVFHSENLK